MPPFPNPKLLGMGPWGAMAMGNYPYPSSYIMHGLTELPAWPMRKACEGLAKPDMKGAELYVGVRKAIAVYVNNTGDQHCFDGLRDYQRGAPKGPAGVKTMLEPHRRFEKKAAVNARRRLQANANMQTAVAVTSSNKPYKSAGFSDDGACAGTWGYQWCTEMAQPFTSGCNGTDIMYPCSEFDAKASSDSCSAEWGITPRYTWVRDGLGGKHGFESASNIVFSNGRLDPWHGGGVLKSPAPTVVALLINDSAHHLDLMFSNPADPQSVIDARKIERENMKMWVEQAHGRHLI